MEALWRQGEVDKLDNGNPWQRHSSLSLEPRYLGSVNPRSKAPGLIMHVWPIDALPGTYLQAPLFFMLADDGDAVTRNNTESKNEYMKCYPEEGLFRAI